MFLSLIGECLVYRISSICLVYSTFSPEINENTDSSNLNVI